MAINLTVASSAPVGLSVGADTGVTLTASAGAGAGTTNYDALNNKPSIEGVELTGNKSLSELNAYTKGQTDTLLSQKADRSEIPSLEGYATQQWVQDKHYLTQHQSLSEYYTKGQTNNLLNGKANTSDIPTKVSDLTNDSGFIDTESDPTVPQWAKQPSKPTYTANEVGALPSTTTIPSKTSDLTNDSGYITLADLPIYNGGVV